MGWRVWLLALGIALATHVLGFSLPWQSKTQSFGAVGVGEDGIEIGLGQTGSYLDQLQQKTIADAAPSMEEMVDEPIAEPEVKAVEVTPAPVKQEVDVKVDDIAAASQEQYVVKPQEVESPKAEVRDVKPQPHKTIVSQEEPGPESEVVAQKSQNGRNQQQATGYGSDRSAGGKVGDARSYFAQLMAWLNQYKRYPSKAKKGKQQGVVHVLFTLSRSGEVIKRSIKKSSGFALLDQAALDMFDAASPLPPIPDFMQRQQLSMVLPVDFSLITNSAFKE